MYAHALPQSLADRTDQTLKVAVAADALLAQEDTKDQKLLILTEFALCFVGVLALISGLSIAWLSFQPLTVSEGADPLFSGGVLVAVGLALYAFGTRGFRRQFIIDMNKQCVEFGRINSKSVCRIANIIPLDQVDSIVVHQAKTGKNMASLMLKERSRPTPHCVLTGPETQIRELHGQICQLLRRTNAQ